MDYKKEWEKPELTVISKIESSENVLEWSSGPPGAPVGPSDNENIPS